MIIEFEQECKDCKGTGLYMGFAEMQGAAVVCYRCKGTGCKTNRIEYSPFRGRNQRTDVTHVYASNPGIGAAPSVVPGGVPLSIWEHDPEAVNLPGAEMREHTCPAWWYQTVDYKKKPDWKECIIVGSFANCRYFPEKAGCWSRWDKEHRVEAVENA